MALGESSVAVVAGGGQQRASAQAVARTVVQVGVSPKGEPNTLYAPGDLSSAVEQFDTGPLVEAIALRHRNGLTAYAVPLTPSTAGVVGAVSQIGTGTGTVAVSLAPHRPILVMCVTGGALGTATFKFSLDGGVTWSALYTSTVSSYVIRVPGTFSTLTFAAATYVAAKTLTVGIDGVVTAGTLWVGTVTQVSSPIDSYDVLCTVAKAGALAVAMLGVSLDGGKSAIPNLATPTSGVVVIPGTGLVLTLAGTFVADDTYSFLCAAPGSSTSDLTAAMAVIRADQTLSVALIHVIGMPSSAAGAISQASTLETQILAGYNSDGVDWQGLCEAPVVGDIVVSGGVAIADTADTDAVLRAARAGIDLIRTGVSPGSHRMTSPITGWKLKRPFGWALVMRFVDTDPRDDLSAPSPQGPLKIFAIGRDEALANALDDVQFNVARRYKRRNGVFLAITRGGFGFKNLTTQAAYQDAGGVRVLNIGVSAIRAAGEELLAQRPPVNGNGTIAETQAIAWDTYLDGVIKRALGLLPGGSFAKPQASLASASVLRSSQLGASPHRLDVEYTIQTLGFISEVSSTVRYSGVITVEV